MRLNVDFWQSCTSCNYPVPLNAVLWSPGCCSTRCRVPMRVGDPVCWCQTAGRSSTAAPPAVVTAGHLRNSEQDTRLRLVPHNTLQPSAAQSSRVPAAAALLGQVGTCWASPVAAKETVYIGCTEKLYLPTATTSAWHAVALVSFPWMAGYW